MNHDLKIGVTVDVAKVIAALALLMKVAHETGLL